MLGTGLVDLRWFLAAVVPYELLLGFWLIAAVFRVRRDGRPRATFGAFAVVAATKRIAGDVSRGCFGHVSTDLWLTLTIGVSAVVAVCWCDLRRGA